MKKTIVFLFLIILLSSGVFAISSTSSDSSVTDKSTTGAAAASASSSDSTITSTVSLGASAVASAYASSDNSISGNPGFPVTTAASASPSTTTTPTSSESYTIPSAGRSSATETTTEPAEEVVQQEEAVPKVTAAVTADQTTITITKSLKAGESLALSPSLVEDALATLFVSQVTEKTATIQIMTQDNKGNLLTGNVVAVINEDVVLLVGESMEVDTNNDSAVDIKIQLTDIKYENSEYIADFDITYYLVDQVTKDFVQQQVETGEVSSFTKLQQQYGVWVIVGIVVLFTITLILKVIQAKRKRRQW